MKFRNAMLLVLTAAIWGVAFVAQSVGMDHVGPWTFICIRNIIGTVVLLPFVFVFRRLNAKNGEMNERRQSPENSKKLLAGGFWCGIVLCAASFCQQYGIMTTAVGKAGFVTAFYIIMVPVLSIFLGKRCGWKVWSGVFLALGGLYFLCVTGKVTAEKGDVFLLLCALLYAVHILVIDYYSPMVDCVAMSCIQFAVCALICFFPMVLAEKPVWGDILAAWKPILYAGALSSGVAYTLQIVGQKGMNPTIASLLMSLESVISVLAGLLLLHQQLSRREYLGCALMFTAIVLAQLPDKKTVS